MFCNKYETNLKVVFVMNVLNGYDSFVVGGVMDAWMKMSLYGERDTNVPLALLHVVTFMWCGFGATYVCVRLCWKGLIVIFMHLQS